MNIDFSAVLNGDEELILWIAVARPLKIVAAVITKAREIKLSNASDGILRDNGGVIFIGVSPHV